MKTAYVAMYLFMLSFCAAAAPQTEVRLDHTHFSHHGDNVWYQKETGPYDLVLNSPSGYLGVTDKVGAFRWHLGARYLGRYSTECECLSSDRAYELGNPTGWPVSTFKTKGDVFGPQATITYEWPRAFLGAGLMYAGASNQVHVDNWYPAVDDTFLVPGKAQTLDVSNRRRWAPAPVVEGGFRIGSTDVLLSATRLNTVQGTWYPIATGWAVSVGLRWVF